jgi:DNA-directed RNA polymerase subunit RPC12/RpoP
MAHKFCQSCGNEVITTMRVCPQCGSKVFSNEPVTARSPAEAQSPNTLVTISPPIKSSSLNPVITSQADSFVGYTSLTKWIKWSLYLQIVVTVIAIISSFLEYQLLHNFQDGIYATVNQAVIAAEASDARQKVIGYIVLITSLVSGALILKWIYLANKNVRVLGATNMMYTPGWSIGYYFMPFTNLWKPYQAMKEIWKASLDPKNWNDQTNPAILRWWWFFWLFSSLFGNVAFRTVLKAKQIGDYIEINVFSLIGEISSIPLILVTLVMISKIYDFQMTHFNKRI